MFSPYTKKNHGNECHKRGHKEYLYVPNNTKILSKWLHKLKQANSQHVTFLIFLLWTKFRSFCNTSNETKKTTTTQILCDLTLQQPLDPFKNSNYFYLVSR